MSYIICLVGRGITVTKNHFEYNLYIIGVHLGSDNIEKQDFLKNPAAYCKRLGQINELRKNSKQIKS